MINSLSPALDRKTHGNSLAGEGALRAEADRDSMRGGSAISLQCQKVVWLCRVRRQDKPGKAGSGQPGLERTERGRWGWAEG